MSIDNGLGGPIRLLLEDAQVPYEWIHIDVAQTWPKTKQSWIDSGYPFDCAPMIKLEDGKQYSGAQPILRFLSKSLGKKYTLSTQHQRYSLSSIVYLGKYIPTNDIDLETFVETVSDYSCDWFKAYGMAARNRVSSRMGASGNREGRSLTKLHCRIRRIYWINISRNNFLCTFNALSAFMV